jgi:hypothetical protein
MKSASMVTALSTLIMYASSGTCAAEEDATKQAPETFTPAKLVRLHELTWPGAVDREALVFVRFTVSPKGTVMDVEPLLDKGFYEDRFIAAAKNAVKHFQFKPARLNGKPVEWTGVIPIRYGIGDTLPGLGSDFRNELKQVESLFSQKDFRGADQHADMMLRDTVKTNYEFAVLKATLARTHEALGQDELALRFAEDATTRYAPNVEPFALHGPVPANKSTYYSLPQQVVESLLEMRMRLDAKNGLLVEARRAYDELAGLETIPPDDSRARIAAQITAKLDSKDPVVANGRIWDEKNWHHELIRNSFELDDVDGDIHFVLLTCGNQRKKLDYVPGEEWSVPPGWRDCSVAVDAAPDSSFHFVETVN